MTICRSIGTRLGKSPLPLRCLCKITQLLLIAIDLSLMGGFGGEVGAATQPKRLPHSIWQHKLGAEVGLNDLNPIVQFYDLIVAIRRRDNLRQCVVYCRARIDVGAGFIVSGARAKLLIKVLSLFG